jgi:hypothetical protein
VRGGLLKGRSSIKLSIMESALYSDEAGVDDGDVSAYSNILKKTMIGLKTFSIEANSTPSGSL